MVSERNGGTTTPKLTKVYDTNLSYRKHIVPSDGPAVFRDEMYAEHNGVLVKKPYLYLPDNSDSHIESITPFIGMGGIMTVGGDYAKTAIATAQEGHMYVTHNPLRGLPVREQLFNKETREHPFRHTAEVGHKVILATLLHLYRDLDIDSNEVDITAHSYGGMTGSELAAMDPHVRFLILQDVAGIIERSLEAHLKGIPGMAKEGYDTYKYIRENIDEVTPDLFTDHKDHVLNDLLLAIREFIALLRDPDLSENVRIARENGVKVAGVMFAKSAFFILESVQKYAAKKGVFDIATIVEDARHIEANVNPVENARLQIALVKRLEGLTEMAA